MSTLRGVTFADARKTLEQILLLAYEGPQLQGELELLLKYVRQEPETALALVEEWRPGLRNWIKNLKDPGRNGCVLGWGAAADQSKHPQVVRIIRRCAQLLVPKPYSCGLVHGSSITGYMGEFDRAWAHALSDNPDSPAYIGTIPLRWISEEVREIPAKNAAKQFRSPPNMLVTARTELFGLTSPKAIICAPGGLGTRFETYWFLLAGQLRNILLTFLTGWEGALPPVLMLDHLMEDEYSDPRRPEWQHDGVIVDFNRGVRQGTFKQHDIDHVTVIRVGKGDDIDGQRVGLRVKYFDDEEGAARFVQSEYARIAKLDV